MNETDKARRETESTDGAGIRKKPYVKPAFIRERAFETMALSCGKVNITQGQCKLNRKNS